MKYLGFLVIGAGLFISSCGTLSRTQRAAKPPPDITLPETTAKGTKIEEGMASWYGPKFHGKLTANGEQYDMNQLTAAHRTLPFNSLVKVKNLDNGKSVVVRINDRGPFAKNRIIDLSQKAARKIGMIGPGTAHVALILLGGTLEDSRTQNLKVPTYTVQLGSFSDETKAFEHSRHIHGSRVVTIREPRNTFYRVYYGTFIDKNKAYDKKRALERRGFRGFVKQIQNN